MLQRTAALICLLALPLPGAGLDGLRAQLQKSGAGDALRASLELQTWNRRGDDKKPLVTQGKASAWVESGPQGLRLSWSRELLAQAVKEERRQAEDPEQTTPTREAMRAMDALAIQDYLDPAARLLRELDRAQVLEERPEPRDGHPATLLVLKLEPRVSARDRKYVKEMASTARIWVDPEGWPLAAELHTKLSGRALLVISFSSDTREEYQFRRISGHLVTTRHASDSTTSGAGETGQMKRVAVLAFN